MSIAWKAMGDTDRNSDGRISRPVCSSIYWFIICGVPILSVLLFVVIVMFVCKCRKRHAHRI